MYTLGSVRTPLRSLSYLGARLGAAPPVPRPPARVGAVRPTAPRRPPGAAAIVPDYLLARRGFWEPVYPGYTGWGGQLGQVLLPPEEGYTPERELMTPESEAAAAAARREFFGYPPAIVTRAAAELPPAPPPAPAPGINWWLVGGFGAGFLALVWLATLGAPVAARAAWAARE